MRRPSLLLACIVAFLPTSVFAQLSGPGTTSSKTTVRDDIRNSPNVNGKVNAWISRNGPIAVVLKVEDPAAGSTLIPAKLSQYTPSTIGVEDYVLRTSTVKLSTGDVQTDRIDVDLEYSGEQRGYKTFTVYARNKKTEGILAWVAFRAGGDRNRSRVLIRINSAKIPDPTLAAGAKATDPCAGPPIDDIGEEELFSTDPDATSQPSRTIPKTPSTASSE
jgi:hypothetical protein